MKTSTLPVIRVKPELREAAEDTLRAAETARQTNTYVSAKDVLAQLDERIAAAKRQ